MQCLIAEDAAIKIDVYTHITSGCAPTPYGVRAMLSIQIALATVLAGTGSALLVLGFSKVNGLPFIVFGSLLIVAGSFWLVTLLTVRIFRPILERSEIRTAPNRDALIRAIAGLKRTASSYFECKHDFAVKNKNESQVDNVHPTARLEQDFNDYEIARADLDTERAVAGQYFWTLIDNYAASVHQEITKDLDRSPSDVNRFLEQLLGDILCKLA